ncbi:hypothetical protein PYW07_002362 [Mythimna separata]|uniref:COMM domain-containing protein n=1 Tax=Mythimna separata TaxID=271217 RepID=A0AAD7YPG6_MYTSE|nr:hypothetical protein PYW07_002362 [Mythimna separata]
MDKIFEIESPEVFENISQHILTKLYYSETPDSLPSHLDDDVITKAKQDLISIISDNNFNLYKIKDAIDSKGWPQEKVKLFHELLETNKSEVFHAALNHYNSNYCDTIVNFDWFLKYVLGTSEMKTLKYPLLQLMMSTLNKNGKQNKIMYDTKKDILLKMINALESIQ